MITAIVIGVAGGYLGGRTDYFLGRLTDLMMSFPNQLFFIAFMPVVMALFVDPQDEMPTWLRACVLIYVMWLLGWMTARAAAARPGALPAGAGVRRGGEGRGASAAAGSSARNCCRTW